MLIQINTQFSDMDKLRSNPDANDGNIAHLLHRTIQCLIGIRGKPRSCLKIRLLKIEGS